jgi:hypothetical protein
MTPWFRLTLVCCVLLGLLLGLTQAVDWNYQPIVRSGSSFDRGTKATSDSPTSSVVGSMAFHVARAGPFGSLVLDCGLTAGNIDPPGQENHGPPNRWGLGKLPVKPATQINATEPLCPRNYWFSAEQFEQLKNRGFTTPFS